MPRFEVAVSMLSRNWRNDRMSAVAGILGVIWLAMVAIAVIGLVRGHLDWARLRTRKHAGWLLAASFVVFILIGVVAPDQPTDGATTPSATSFATATRAVTSSPAVSSTTKQPTTAATTVPESAARVPPVPSVTPTRLSAPVPFVPPPPAPPSQPVPAPAPTAAPNVYYANCAAARDAGAAPLRRGEPGYRKELDRNNDGVACE
ncbi:excalibur calcium-binding domain-containing protein [Nocardia brasiliensis]